MEVLARPPAASPAPPATGCACCGAPRHGAYCAHCGQHFLEGERLTFRVLWREFARRTLNLDDGLLYTARTLFLRGPGTVARRYVDGERRRFTSPITFFAICCALYLVVFTLVRDDYLAILQAQMVQGFEAQAGGDGTVDPEKQRFLDEVALEMPVLIAEFVSKTFYVSLLTIIPAALAYRLFFGPVRTLPEVAVLLIYTQSMITLTSMLIFPFLVGFGGAGAQYMGIAVIAIGACFAAWGVARFYGSAWWQLLLGALGYIISGVFMMVLGGLLGAVFVILKLMELRGLTLLEVLHRLAT